MKSAPSIMTESAMEMAVRLSHPANRGLRIEHCARAPEAYQQTLRVFYQKA